jgi:hypothetical protein
VEAMPKRTSRSGAIAISQQEAVRGVLLWLLATPIPVIILLYVFHVM